MTGNTWIIIGVIATALAVFAIPYGFYKKSIGRSVKDEKPSMDGGFVEEFRRFLEEKEMSRSHEPKEITKLILDFTNSYWSAIEEAMDKHGRDLFTAHGDKVEIVSVFQAKDGFAVFYLPVPPDPAIKRGLYLFDEYTEHTLNEICQSLTVHRLKVLQPEIGLPVELMPSNPEDTQPIEGITAPWIHDDVRRAAMEGKLDSLPGITISPSIKVEEGIYTAILPGRKKVWSPVFEFKDIGVRRLFLWTHADFWWLPESLDLKPEIAAGIAAKDINALKTLLAYEPLRPPHFAEPYVPSQAADLLESECQELLSILDRTDHSEEELHQWLNTPNHYIFLDPHISKVWSKLSLGEHITDFVIQRSDSTYLLVEIEPGNTPIFTKTKSEPTAAFNHACQQVRDWQRYVRDNVHTVRTELGLSDIYEPQGMAVIGRSAEIATKAASLRWRDMKNTYSIDVYTYDELCERIRSLATSLRVIVRTSDDTTHSTD